MAKPVPIVDDYPAIAHRLRELTDGIPKFTLPNGVEILVTSDVMTMRFRADTIVGLVLHLSTTRPKLSIAHIRNTESARGILLDLVDRLRRFYPSILTDRSEIYFSREDTEQLIRRLNDL